MNFADIKKKIIAKIEQSENEQFLHEIMRLIKLRESEEDVYILSDEQKNAVEEARASFAKGESITQEELDRKMERWRKK